MDRAATKSSACFSFCALSSCRTFHFLVAISPSSASWGPGTPGLSSLLVSGLTHEASYNTWEVDAFQELVHDPVIEYTDGLCVVQGHSMKWENADTT